MKQNSITLQELISQRMKERGLTRSKLIQAIGYSKNISKGLRKLDNYLLTLKVPSDEFVANLLSILEINGLLFSRAFAASEDKLNAEINARAEEQFKPYLEFLIDFNNRPSFITQNAPGRCTASLPEHIQHLTYTEEISSVIAIYNEQISNLSWAIFADSFEQYLKHDHQENLIFRKNIIGFRYHRKYDYYIEFDNEFRISRIEFTNAKTSNIYKAIQKEKVYVAIRSREDMCW